MAEYFLGTVFFPPRDERKIIAITTSGTKTCGHRAHLMSLAAQRDLRTSLRCGAVPGARVHHAMPDFDTVGIIDVACG